jgi:hypothetical protein
MWRCWSEVTQTLHSHPLSTGKLSPPSMLSPQTAKRLYRTQLGSGEEAHSYTSFYVLQFLSETPLHPKGKEVPSL